MISTHTLTWSVTYPEIWVWTNYIISTHTLTWSVTDEAGALNFNKKISTHTLTWSVTFKAYVPIPEIGNFNSHAHVERDIFGLPIYLV